MKSFTIKSKLILFAVFYYSTINAQNHPEFKSFNISNTFYVDYLSFIKPNLAIVPVGGGLYCPNLQAWYLKANDTILSAEPSYNDTTLIITLRSGNLSEIEKIYPDSDRKPVPLAITRGYVFYTVPSNFLPDTYYYVVGDEKGFNICRLRERNVDSIDKYKVDTLLRSDTMINELQVINDSAILYTMGTNVSCMIRKSSYPIFSAAKRDSIYGFTMDYEGNLYISLQNGIFKIEKNKKAYLIIGDDVKGKLKYFNKVLYILDIKNNKLDLVSNF